MFGEAPRYSRLYADESVYWTATDLLPVEQRTGAEDYLKDNWERFWVNPSDGHTRTRKVLSYRDSLTILLMHEDDGVIGYDTSFKVDDERLETLYSNRLDPAVTPHLGDQDIALVYHFVIDEAYRGKGYGVGTAFLRQNILENRWGGDWTGKTPSDHYADILRSMDNGTPLTAEFPETAERFTGPLKGRHGYDAVVSLPRLFETPVDKEHEIISRAYRISEGFGFQDANLPLNGDDRLVYKTDPDVDIRIPAGP